MHQIFCFNSQPQAILVKVHYLQLPLPQIFKTNNKDINAPKDMIVKGYCTDTFPKKFDYDDEDSKLKYCI